MDVGCVYAAASPRQSSSGPAAAPSPLLIDTRRALISYVSRAAAGQQKPHIDFPAAAAAAEMSDRVLELRGHDAIPLLFYKYFTVPFL